MISARTRSGAIISLDSAADEAIKQLAEVCIGLPDKFLGEVELLDLSGLANPLRADNNEFATTRVDAIVWCTPCTQAWKESERVASSRLPERLKRNSILVVTFCDLVKNDRERQRVIERLEQIAHASFLKIVSTASTPGAVGSGHNLLRQLCLEHAETLKLDRLIRAAQMADRLLQTILVRLCQRQT